jgi:ATP synthase protein I
MKSVSRNLYQSDPPVEVDLGEVRRLAWRLVLGQAAVSILAALICQAGWGARAGASALAGGGISTAASLAMALVAFGRLARGGAHRVVLAFFAGEVVKLAVIVTLFVIVLRTTKVSPGALLGSYLATFLVYWIALAGALSSKRWVL